MIKTIALLVTILLVTGCSGKEIICDDYAHEVYELGELVILNSTGETVRVIERRIRMRLHCDINGKHYSLRFSVRLEDGHMLRWLKEKNLSKAEVL